MTSAFNEIFNLKFEFAAHVEGEGQNKKINISLDRKIVASESTGEVVIQKDIYKTIEMLKSKIKQDKKGLWKQFLFDPKSFFLRQCEREEKAYLHG